MNFQSMPVVGAGDRKRQTGKQPRYESLQHAEPGGICNWLIGPSWLGLPGKVVISIPFTGKTF